MLTSTVAPSAKINKRLKNLFRSHMFNVVFALQDLSAARYSGHMERRETVTESRVYTSHTGYQVDRQ
jgi:hypothetical protein